MSEKYCIIADGEPNNFLALHDSIADHTVIALDGAFEKCIAHHIIPDVLIGDSDSISASALRAVKNYPTQVFHHPEQDTTDCEKALLYCQKNNAQHLKLFHATGQRLDHTLYNCRLLKKFHGVFASLELHTNIEVIRYVENSSAIIHSHAQQHCAVMAFVCAKVTSIGLQYEMDNLILKFAESESACNHTVKNKAMIHVEGGALIMASSSCTIES